MTRGRRAYPESSVLHSWPIPGSRAFQLPQGEFPCRHRGGHGNPKGAPKEDSFLFLRAMPSSHTPSGSCRKTNSREKALGARTEPHPTRKMSAFFSGFLCRGGLLLSFLWYRIHKMMAAVLLLVCGTARNRIGQQQLPFRELGWTFCHLSILSYLITFLSQLLKCSFQTAH